MHKSSLPKPEEYYSYDRLENASRKLHLNPSVPENEERLMNLHNHLVWRSYSPGKDKTADAIFCAVIRDVMKDYKLQKEDVPVIYRGFMELAERRSEKWIHRL